MINLRDQIEFGWAAFLRLGFTLTPRGYHTLGSMDHLAIFGTDYLELIAAPAGERRRADILDAPIGLNGLIFGTEDSASVHAALAAAGVPVEPPEQFSRPVEIAGGKRDAVFRTVRLTSGAVPAGRVYFCHHFTRDLVWRDEWRHHANGVVGIARAVIAAREPNGFGALFARMFGESAEQPILHGFSLAVGLARVDVITPAALLAAFGPAAPDVDGRDEFMAALTLRTRSLDLTAAALAAGGVEGLRESDRTVVPAKDACGVALEFRA